MRVVPRTIVSPSSGPTTDTAGSGMRLTGLALRRSCSECTARALRLSKTRSATSIPYGYRCSVELRTLRYFVAVAEELHFGRAAARLHMSQPPLSRAIKQLETEVGALLFDRSPAGVTLTPVGAVLLDEARALLDQADRVRVRVAAAAGAATLTVGILGDSTDPGITRLAGRLPPKPPRRRHPHPRHRPDRPDLRAARRTGRRRPDPGAVRRDRPDGA